jgi:hypothetical protein
MITKNIAFLSLADLGLVSINFDIELREESSEPVTLFNE